MKKPRSYLQSIAEANAGRVTVVKMHGKAYLATLPPLATTPVVAPAVMAAPAAAATAAMPVATGAP